MICDPLERVVAALALILQAWTRSPPAMALAQRRHGTMINPEDTGTTNSEAGEREENGGYQ
ncbi:MAG TPA: hypothetical protein VF637_07845 [Sphingomicrobium sp.]|jgi:hypothetical protein